MSPATWIVVGATRGIGLEIVRQLLHRGERVIATVRNTSKASQLWTLSAGAAAPRLGSWCRLLECDVTVDESINVCFFFLFPYSLFLVPHSSMSVSPSLRAGEITFYHFSYIFLMQVAPYLLSHLSGILSFCLFVIGLSGLTWNF